MLLVQIADFLVVSKAIAGRCFWCPLFVAVVGSSLSGCSSRHENKKRLSKQPLVSLIPPRLSIRHRATQFLFTLSRDIWTNFYESKYSHWAKEQRVFPQSAFVEAETGLRWVSARHSSVDCVLRSLRNHRLSLLGWLIFYFLIHDFHPANIFIFFHFLITFPLTPCLTLPKLDFNKHYHGGARAIGPQCDAAERWSCAR